MLKKRFKKAKSRFQAMLGLVGRGAFIRPEWVGIIYMLVVLFISLPFALVGWAYGFIFE